MQIDTFRDIIHWTRTYHKQLAESLKNSSSAHQNERARMLLDYLAEHEAKLSDAISAFEKIDNLKVLNTWVMEYLNKADVKPAGEVDAPFATLSTEEIINSVEGEHAKIIDLYRYLADRAVTTPAVDLLKELAALEQHEAMRLARASNLLRDL